MKFQLNWRKYQKRVLEQLQIHLDDKHLNVVAAPGSGKTILGIEVIRRLNKPTVIFSPTITIREQWIDRIKKLFFHKDYKDYSWISTNIRQPSFLTITTYQALNSAISIYNKDESKTIKTTEILQNLRKQGVKVFVFDEAHHLRKEWWSKLIWLKNELFDPVIVSLTATPPLDVNLTQWERYTDLCGEVDAEISVPELVKEKNLCPHQDFIYLSIPTKNESTIIKEFRDNIKNFNNNIIADKVFIKILSSHPFVNDLKNNLDKALSEPIYLTSIAVFLKKVRVNESKNLMKIITGSSDDIPDFNIYWLEKLLYWCFFVDEIMNNNKYVEDLKKILIKLGGIERRKVNLKSNYKLRKTFKRSISKLDSIIEIVKLERNNLYDKLRLVILTDYIRMDFLPKENQEKYELNKIGVITIFEKLRRLKKKDIKLGVLTGKIAIIPKDSEKLLLESIIKLGLSDIKMTQLKHDEKYLSLKIIGIKHKNIVKLLTYLLKKGGITVLIGTQALLGEGWDAPCINSLILASFVGSYMLSNQMRGRAIRTYKEDPQKTANIWHLCCVEENSNFKGDDLYLLDRRFKAFYGVALEKAIIKNNINRMNIPEIITLNTVKKYKKKIEKISSDREKLKNLWDEALLKGDIIKNSIEIKNRILKKYLPKKFILRNTLLGLLLEGLFIGSYFFAQFLRSSYRLRNVSLGYFLMYLGITLIISAIISLPKVIKAIWLFFKHGTLEKSLKVVGNVLLETLFEFDIIDSDNKVNIMINEIEDGSKICSVEGCSNYGKSLFLNSMRELFSPIDNPRYIIIRKSFFGRIKRKDYYAVPNIIGKNKKYTEFFTKLWKKKISNVKLIYTRTQKGRLDLLKARNNSLSSKFQKKSEIISRWE